MLYPVASSDLDYDWYESVLQLNVEARRVLEAREVCFTPETEPPFSWEGGPVSSGAARCDLGLDFWIVADEVYKNDAFQTSKRFEPDLRVDVRAAPEVSADPVRAAQAFVTESGVDPVHVEWTLPNWDERVEAELTRRRAPFGPPTP